MGSWTPPPVGMRRSARCWWKTGLVFGTSLKPALPSDTSIIRNGVLVQGISDSREIKVLNRYMRWPVGGDIDYPRHAQVIARELNLEGGKSVTSPAVKYDIHNDGELKGADVKKYRSLTMTTAYLSMDRYDIQHAAKELATEMKMKGWSD